MFRTKLKIMFRAKLKIGMWCNGSISAFYPAPKLTGHSVTVARVLRENLAPVRIWVPRKLIFGAGRDAQHQSFARCGVKFSPSSNLGIPTLTQFN